MKKMPVLYIIAVLLVISASGAFADVGETQEEAAAPAQVQAPAEKPAAQVVSSARPVQEAAAAPSRGRVIRETTLKEMEPESFTGRVDCVYPASLARPKGSIVVVDDNGQSCEFIVKCLAVIYSPDGAMLSLCEIGPGARVQVNYRTRPTGAKEAFSVKVMK